MSQSLKYIDDFLEMLVVERGTAQATLDAYARDLRLFWEFNGSDINQANTDDIRNYLKQMEREGTKASTAARRLTALRQFFRFLYAEGMRDDEPTESIHRPRQVRPLPSGLTEAEVERLLEAASIFKGAEGIRLVALMELLYATGLRSSELLTLPYPAVQSDRPFIVVKGKAERERMVPLTEQALRALEKYEKVRLRFIRRPADTVWLFPSRSSGGHLTRQRFSKLVKNLAECAGIDAARVSPLSLRQAFTAHLLANGFDPLYLQQILGVKNIDNVLRYARVSEQQKQDLVRSTHPLSGKMY